MSEAVAGREALTGGQELSREPQAIKPPLQHQRKSSFTPASLGAPEAVEAATVSGGGK